MTSIVKTTTRPWWRPRWYELAPEGVLAVGLTVFLIDETDAATSAFKSARAIALMVVVGIAWLAARALAARLSVPVAARLAVFGIAAAVVLAVVVLPAYDDDTVTETLETSAPASPSGPAATAAEPPAQPARIRTGSFEGIDHRARGTVSIYRHSDGRHVVGLEDFDVQPGPDYDLYVVPGADRDDLDNAVRLDDLRGNRGTQFYDVPSGADVGSGPWTVLIWCQTFRVPIANATPA